jgi:hypothetical protein
MTDYYHFAQADKLDKEQLESWKEGVTDWQIGSYDTLFRDPSFGRVTTPRNRRTRRIHVVAKRLLYGG